MIFNLMLELTLSFKRVLCWVACWYDFARGVITMFYLSFVLSKHRKGLAVTAYAWQEGSYSSFSYKDKPY